MILLIFIFSYTIFVIWCVKVFSHQGKTTMGIALSKKELLWLFILECLTFLIMYVSYEASKSPDIASGFAWRYSIAYARGILPYALLMSINDDIFKENVPTVVYLVIAILFDLLFLRVLTIIRKQIKPLKQESNKEQ